MNQNAGGTAGKRLESYLDALDKCYHARPAIKADRRKYFTRFLSILEKCPYALAPNANGKELVRQLEDGARTLQEIIPNHVPFEPIPPPVNYHEAERVKESVCLELALLLLEKYPYAIEAGVGGERLVRSIKEIADTVGAYLLAQDLPISDEPR